MRSFKDTEGREWILKLTLAEVEEIRDQAGIDIGDLDQLRTAFDDTRKFIALLMPLVADQVAARNLSPKEFKRGFDAVVLEAASKAVLAEIVSFSPRPQQAAELLTALEAREKLVRQRQQAKMAEAIRRIASGEMDETMTPSESVSSNSAGDSPASLASTQDP